MEACLLSILVREDRIQYRRPVFVIFWTASHEELYISGTLYIFLFKHEEQKVKRNKED